MPLLVSPLGPAPYEWHSISTVYLTRYSVVDTAEETA